MKTKIKDRIKNLQHCGRLLWEYSFYIRQQLRDPLIYLSSAPIGLLVIWMMNRFSFFAFLIPFIVQTAAQAMSQFKNRDLDTLLLLPGQREDPVFIMDLSSNILLTTGRTEQLFKKNSTRNIIALIKADGFDRLINNLDRRCPDPETRSIDVYSEALKNWYEIKFKLRNLRC